MHYISEVLGHHSIDFTRKLQSRLCIEERPSRAGRTQIEAGMTLAQKWHTGFPMGVADRCKLPKNLVATGGIEPPTLGL